MKLPLAVHVLAGVFSLAASLKAVPVSANETVYPPTAPGTIEVKLVPPARALQAEGSGTYFGSSDRLFGSLFRNISANDVAMTVPVEADVTETPRMRFFVGSKDSEKRLELQGGVSLVSLPERRVLAVGLSGSYSAERFEEGRALLEAWLVEHPEWVATGAAYAVYWNGPFVPWFAKRSEVHVPIAAVVTGSTSSP